jgi:hypothetical protein
MAGRGWDPDARTTTVQLNPAASSLASLASITESEQEPSSSCRNHCLAKLIDHAFEQRGTDPSIRVGRFAKGVLVQLL